MREKNFFGAFLSFTGAIPGILGELPGNSRGSSQMRGRFVTRGRPGGPTDTVGARGRDLAMRADGVIDEEEDGEERKTGGGFEMIRKCVNSGLKIEHF